MDIYGVSTVVLFILKVTGLLTISWWLVFAPILIGFIISLVVHAFVSRYSRY